MLPSILEQIDHFQQHGCIRASRRNLAREQLEPRLQRIHARLAAARQCQHQPEPGWLQLHSQGWERFYTQQRCLHLEYGRCGPGSGLLLAVRISPDGTALMRVTSLDLALPEQAFQQRLYCPAPRLRRDFACAPPRPEMARTGSIH